MLRINNNSIKLLSQRFWLEAAGIVKSENVGLVSTVKQYRGRRIMFEILIVQNVPNFELFAGIWGKIELSIIPLDFWSSVLWPTKFGKIGGRLKFECQNDLYKESYLQNKFSHLIYI